MSLSLFGLLVLFSLAARRAGWRWLARSVGAITLVSFLAVACGPVPAWLLDHLQRGYSATPFVHWSPRNVIVLLASGTVRIDDDSPLRPTLFANGRILEAVTLYRSCKLTSGQCLILVSGGDAQHHGSAESTVYAAVLTKLGVEPQDIQTETQSTNTFDNARYSRALILVFDPQTLVLVTSSTHLRRSLLDFQHFGMKPLPVGADVVSATPGFWPQAANLQLCDLALHEYIGMAQFHVYEALGWNTMPVLGPVEPRGRA
jgi:uncharacterized SAM-binding protein YcdF (DUF218 family)